MVQHAFAIAIDGPVASGKGTIAHLLAEKLHGFHLNTGAMYRALTLYCLENHIDVHNNTAVLAVLQKTAFIQEDDTIRMNGKDVTDAIKNSQVTAAVPIVAAFTDVRAEMVRRQREIGLGKIAKGQIVLVDARDAATKIFPDAPIKIFLTASPQVRAKRRLEQLGGTDYNQMLEEVKKRDFQDMTRAATPLVYNPQKHGYFVLDNSNLTKSDTIALILEKIQHDTR